MNGSKIKKKSLNSGTNYKKTQYKKTFVMKWNQSDEGNLEI